MRRMLSRRSFLSLTALGGAGLLLQSCGGTSPSGAPSISGSGAAGSTAAASSAKPSTVVQQATSKPGNFNGTITEGQNGEAKFNNPVLIVDTDGEWHTDLMFDR